MRKYQIAEAVFDTAWGHASLVQAHIALLKEALKNPLNQWFALVSADTLPMNSLNGFMRFLRALPDRSTVVGCKTDTPPDTLQRFKSAYRLDPERFKGNWWVQRYIHTESLEIFEQEQFFILSRAHAEMLADMPMKALNDFQELLEFSNANNLLGYSPDECVPVSYLECLGVPRSEFVFLTTMFAVADSNGMHGIVLSSISEKVREDPDQYFFARKYGPKFNRRRLKPLWKLRDAKMSIHKELISQSQIGNSPIRKSSRVRKLVYNVQNFAELERLCMLHHLQKQIEDDI